MGNFVMPKHTGLVREFTVPLKVCYEKKNENEGWIPNGHATRKEEGFTYSIYKEYNRLGDEVVPKTDNSDYTKDAQIPLYFGFIEGRGHNNAEKRITPQGIKMHEAIEANDVQTQYELLINAFETKTFGRNNQGFPTADSDVEVPNVLLLSSIFLDGVTRQEFYYVIFLMHTKGWDLARAVAEIMCYRETGNRVPDVPNNYADCKLIPLFVSIRFLIEDSQNRLHIAENVYNDFAERIFRLKSKNEVIINQVSKQCNENELKSDTSPFQTIYYGTPGSGKSHKVKELVKESYFDEQELEEFVFRTTFHPDSDYASFVGCYKPNSKNKSLLNGNNYTESQLLARFFDSKEGDNIKARYLYESLINTVDIRNLNLDANIIAEKLKEKGFDKTAYVGEANCMYRIYDWLKEDGYLIDSKISYEFCPQAFTKAYVKAWQNPGEPVYLIIEEINRGNCAQIFGDLFQLLDRKDGVSEYPIDADNDLKDYLEKELGVGHDGIANGKLRLPSNLNILATMNTSDQSLFPMDSAFKRRWSWQCVPIEYEEKKRDGSENKSYYFTINIDNDLYSWHDFLKKVNVKIKKTTLSEDKQMGNFFITNSIDERQFIDKVMFYLWNDICKDEYGANSFFRRYIDENNPESEFSFNDLFEENYKDILTGFMKYLSVEIIKTENNSEQ